MEFIPGLIIAVVAFAAGIYAGRLIAPSARKVKELEESIEEQKQENQNYKNQVGEHFNKSANLFGEITSKYRSLYEHMSSGAYELCERRTIPRELSGSHVDIMAIEKPEISSNFSDVTNPIDSDPSELNNAENPSSLDMIVDVTRTGMSPLDPESQILAEKNRKGHSANQSQMDTSQDDKEQLPVNDQSAEIIDIASQRSEDEGTIHQAKDYAIKAKGVINHNSLNRDDVNT